ncbi:hypothetical protein GF323_05870 [Candidatus Woesearchaeota archaeon]|nr:hypothetical protein [Candidatus Woesearchaeota archaeon]
MADIEPYGVMPQSKNELLKSVNNLTKHMDTLLEIFRSATDEMKLEEQEEKALSQQVRPLMDKLDEIIEQNKIIAEGMVALSDIVKEKFPERQKAPRHFGEKFQQQQGPFDTPNNPPSVPPDKNMPPPMFPNMPPPGQQNKQDSMNAPSPPESQKKRGFFRK